MFHFCSLCQLSQEKRNANIVRILSEDMCRLLQIYNLQGILPRSVFFNLLVECWSRKALLSKQILNILCADLESMTLYTVSEGDCSLSVSQIPTFFLL